ncbi:unnamed protein product, partial [Sphacelaria rigidula]
SNRLAFSYYTPPTLLGVAPNFGPVDGGTSVIITGLGFSNRGRIECSFGGVKVQGHMLSETEVACTSPAMVAPSDAPVVSVTTNGVDFSREGAPSATFTYVSSPEMSVLSPRLGPAIGGTRVTVLGRNFVGGGTAVDEASLLCRFEVEDQASISTESSNAALHLASISDFISEVSVNLLIDGRNVSSVGLPYHYYGSPMLQTASPTAGVTTGGTEIVIKGSGFMLSAPRERSSGQAICAFGNTTTSAVLVSDAELRCRSPQWTGSVVPITGTSVAVTVSLNDGINFGTSSVRFDYLPIANAAGVFPSTVPPAGGSEIFVSGSGFSPSDYLSCSFQPQQGASPGSSEWFNTMTIVTAKWISPEEVVCITPTLIMPVKSPLNATMPFIVARVAVLNDGVTMEGAPWVELIISNIPIITAIAPTAGYVTGNTTVAVLGEGFLDTDGLSCVFGDTGAVSVEYVSPTQITCVSPPLLFRANLTVEEPAHETVELTVSNNGVHYTALSAIPFRYVTPVRISTIHPSLPRVGAAGTLVTILGKGFLDSPGLMCRFGELSQTPIVVDAAKTGITCKAPRQETGHGIVAVEISNNLVDWTSSGVTFRYRPRTVVNSITPKIGPVSGNTIVRVAVAGLAAIIKPVGDDDDDSTLSCRFGSRQVKAARASDDEISCASPAVTEPGAVTVEIFESGVALSDSRWRFDYVPDVQVSGGDPSAGPEAGGTNVIITGNAFLGVEPVVCEFGAPAFRVAGRWQSRIAFMCEAPPHQPGVVPLRVSTNGQQYVDTGLVYTYQPQATVTAVSPTSGSVYGGTSIVVSGTGFVSSTKVACLLGEQLGEAAYVDSTHILCRVPRADIQDRASSVAVRIANNGVDFTDTSEIAFEYVLPIELVHIAPTLGPTTGGTIINVHGMGFSASLNVQCVIDSVAVVTTVISSTLLTCATPNKAIPGVVEVELTQNGLDRSSTSVTFLYHTPVDVVSVYPSSAPESGESALLVSGSGFVETAELACAFTLSTGGVISSIYRKATFYSGSLISCQSPAGSVGTAYLQVTNNGADLSNSSTSLTVTSKSTITSLWPSSGSTYGGTRIRVRGTGFLSSSTVFCKFGNDVVSAEVVVDYTTVICMTPPSESEGSVLVQVTNNNVDWTSSGVEFTFRPPISISSVSPKSGPIGGGTLVRVVVMGIHADIDRGTISCRFGQSFVSAAFIDADGTVLCVSPSASSSGASSLELSRNGVEFTSDGWTFYYVPDMMVESAWPLMGPESGGTMITLDGHGFSDIGDVVCEFGSPGSRVPAIGISVTVIHCRSPAHMPGTISLRVGVNGQQFVETGVIFDYLMESTVRRLQPSLGPVHGGTEVEVVGAAFVNSTTLSCRLADRVVPATFVNKELVLCVTPPSPSILRLSLEVSNNGIDFTTSGILFSFVAAFDIIQVWPTSGPTTGGTLVTVQGSGFSGGDKVVCIFGGSQAAATVHSDDELSCLAPRAMLEGSTYLRLTNNGVDMVSAPTHFTYVTPIRLTNINPTTVGEEGGETVVITGEHFIASPSLACRFGSQDTVPAFWLSLTEVSCSVPPSRAGPHEATLAVTNNGQDFASTALTYTYLPTITVLKIDPVEGPMDGGTEISIVGSGLGQTGLWACIFGESVAVPAVQLPNDALRCQSPAHEPGEVSVRVFRSSSALASDFGMRFLYQATVYISTVEPRSGSNLGGTPVTLRGFGFNNASALTCGFEERNGKIVKTPALRASVGMVVCSSPPLHNPSIVSVLVSLNGLDFTRRGPQYVYYEPVEVVTVFPSLGSINGGTFVTITGRNFLPSEGLSCRFGMSAPSPADFIASNALRCVTPPAPAGPATVEVTVSNNLMEFSASSAKFVYHPALRAERFSPAAGPLSGGTPVVIDGSGFPATSRLACRFGRVEVKATLGSPPTRMICVAPKLAWERRVPVQVTANGIDWENVGVKGTAEVDTSFFTYYKPPKLRQLHPSIGSLFGGTRVSIFI